MNRIYACIDLKSFYASVECVERKLDPLKTNLVVADNSRTEKTVCLAISPSMKQYGLSGRARLYEVMQKVKEINFKRKKDNRYRNFVGKSFDDIELKQNKNLELDLIVAVPRMAYYIKYSTDIYNIYLKYLDKDDIYVYSIDEVFCDITDYLNYNKMKPREFVTMIIHDVYKTTGITATAGLGTNMYLAKVAMDIVAKHVDADMYGVRIAGLDEMTYRKRLWNHRPLTSFWRVGRGYLKKLEANGLYTMGDIARCSLENEELLYKLFGVNAELLIDHAWGYEPCTIKDIKNYKPLRNSVGSGQVLHVPYDYNKTRLIIKEMIDLLVLDLVSKKLITNQIILTIGYDIDNLSNNYDGDVTKDYYGRVVPKPAHGTINIDHKTSSSKIIMEYALKLYDKIINKKLLVRRVNITFNDVSLEEDVLEKRIVKQFDLFSDYEVEEEKIKLDKLDEEKDKKIQNVILDIKNKYGKNSIIKGMNLSDGATTIDRNRQIGGHRE